MLKQKLKLILVSLMLAVQAFAPGAMAKTLNVRAYGTDQVAGYASLLKTSMIAPGKKVVFVVERPDRSIIQIPAEADLEGIARADFYGHQTKQAGIYKVAVYYPGTADASPQNTFSIYPDKVSGTQSMAVSSSAMVPADGREKSFVTVTLYDAYRNPIRDHQLKLISSRPEDKIESINGSISDEQGRASFKVTSAYPGVSVFTAMDASANEILNDREEIVFYKPSETREIGGNYLSANLFSANILNDQNVIPGPLSYFDIEDIPSTVKVNTDQTMTVIARDKDGNVAKNYTGSVLISVLEDDNATLPSNGEYKFNESDQGQFTFNLALRFSALGKQTIQVFDKNDWKIKGEFTVDVVSSQAVNLPNSNDLEIKSPLDGAIFAGNTVLISGQGDPNINLHLYKDDLKIADSETDSDGFFSYQVTNLSPGSHTFYVTNDFNQVSDSVTVTVDSLPPVLDSLQISPQGIVTPGKMLTITLMSEPDLAEVAIRFQGMEKALFPVQGQPGAYRGTVSAPAGIGNYPIDVILVDDFGNQSELLSQRTLSVQEEPATVPPQVKSLEGLAGNGEVMLLWDEVVGHDQLISHYNIYGGTSMSSLSFLAKTDNEDALYKLSNLKNGTQYFFAVTAVDAKGIESQSMSTVIAVTPRALQGNVQAPLGSGNVLTAPQNAFEIDDAGIDIFAFNPSAPEIDPVLQLPELESIVPQLPQASLFSNPLMGSSSPNAMTLSWQAFPGVDAMNYKVYFGLESGVYADYVLVEGNQTTAVVQDLIHGIPYFFAVVALDANGEEISPLSAEFVNIPAVGGLHSGAPASPLSDSPLPVSNFDLSQVNSNSQVGFPAWALILASLLASAGFYTYKRRLFSNHF